MNCIPNSPVGLFSRLFLVSVMASFMAIFWVTMSACGTSESNTHQVVRSQPRQTPAFFQFKHGVGNTPQRPFDPKYAPASRSKKDARKTRESAGVLVFTSHNKELWVLLGKESSDHLWNFMRGSVEAGDSYVKTAAAELYEETATLYQATEEVLLSESFDVYEENHSYACTFFVELEYRASSLLMDALKAQTLAKYKEMTDYRWIRLQDLNTALTAGAPQFSATTVDGVAETFSFRPYSFRLLVQAHRKGILTHLP